MEKYLENKEKGLVTMTKEKTGICYIHQKRYDSFTGEVLPDEVNAVDPADLLTEKARLQEQIDNINALLADCNAII